MSYRWARVLCSGLFLVPLGWSFAANAEKVRLVDSSGEPMPDLVVYLEAKNSQQHTVGNKVTPPLEIHQKDKQFTPYITVMQKGYELQFVNDDDITHHIYSAAGPKRFSFKLRKDNSTKTLRFEQEGHISMGCNIHDWMSGHLLVVDTPYFAIADESGEVEFDGVPNAEYELMVWHPQLQVENNTLMQTVTTSSSTPIIVTIDVPMADIPEQKSLDDFDFLEGY
ncbi:hypothetical protein [Shewanella woodyi]|uniref:Plastocyanin n=1 Tax=Shewanella woodyi (strain ATCC 51908 / MS32) TaxID=392500 RepID=B1KKK2_SHEWM|nr:hypothetical protein [Shewanella woodyi]ACA87219.1 conserved hypothetical protein [Shewanella woodyi ATCC 51908]